MAQARELLRNAEQPERRRGAAVRATGCGGASWTASRRGSAATSGAGPGGCEVGEGLHQIEVKKQGYWPYTTYIEPHGARAVLEVRLQAMGSETPEGGAP